MSIDPFDDNSNPEKLLREHIEELEKIFETFRNTPAEEFQSDAHLGIKNDATEVLNLAEKCQAHSASLRETMLKLRDSIAEFLNSIRYYLAGEYSIVITL